MLKKFTVKNFKNFEHKLIFDLSEIKNYKFNKEAINNNLVKTSIVYGINGSGKSNLGYAVFDIVKHITSKQINDRVYLNYQNANSNTNEVEFFYEFKFNKNIVSYYYTKTSYNSLVKEEIRIDNKIYLSVDRSSNKQAIINAKGAETLNKNLQDSNISIINYVKNNALLDKTNKENKLFYKLIDFIDKMLFFRSLNDGNFYMGYMQGGRNLTQDIINKNNVKKFEAFLNKLGIDCKLDTFEDSLNNSKEIVQVFKNKKLPFLDIASTGTRALTLFYFWFQRIEEDKIKFVFVDEFDAFYHYELSRAIIKILKEKNIQTVVTTHNISLMTNDLLRPDCYFIIDSNKIKNIANLTNKELREAHNLEKMYKAHSFEL